ncbi:MAG: hypothetical protein V1827_00565 [Candidatus Micrarchaeota archaeon]
MFSYRPDSITLAAIGAFIILMILAAFWVRPIFDNPRMVAVEAPLHKNMDLQLKDGENYSYTYTTAASSINITYTVHEIPGCTLITIVEANNTPAVCLDRTGVARDGSNTTFVEPAILLFKPWMLALNDSWTWNGTVYLAFDGAAEHVSDLTYRVVRREIFEGREAFVVEIKTINEGKEYEWVDAEKRILLKALGPGYEVVLND